MIKILIVDDEVLVRLGVKSIMDWEKHGFQIIGEASDGEEALELINQETPDIVLTDLTMDPMDGFELIKHIKKDYECIPVIVLSCHNDFENVRKAMKLGAVDYIFKLILREDELVSTLNEVIRNRGVLGYSKDSSSSRTIKKNRGAILSKMFRRVMENSYSSIESMVEEMNQVNVKCDFNQRYMLLLLSINNYYKCTLTGQLNEIGILKYAIHNIIVEVLEGQEQVEIIDYDADQFVIAINLQQDDKRILNIIREKYQLINGHCTKYLKTTMSASSSGIHTSLKNVRIAYNEAIIGIEQRFYKGYGLYEYGNEVRKNNMKQNDVRKAPPSNNNLFIEVIQSLNKEKIVDYIEKFITSYCINALYKPHDIRRYLSDLMFVMKLEFNNFNLDIAGIKNNYGFDIFQVVSNADCSDDIKTEICFFIDKFIDEVQNRNELMQRTEIIEIKEFVYSCLHEEMNITKAAKHVNMSGSYFSHMFKKETGESFIAFVNRVKIEEAKRLLLLGEMKIYEVGIAVGFTNSNYFSLLFRKLVGLSPKQFMESNNMD